jgi:ribA/ribD-fused uncharacterized protein
MLMWIGRILKESEMADEINAFRGVFRFLSNFHPSPIQFGGIDYPTVEHAYQAQKTLDPKERRKIALLENSAGAKSVGGQLKLREDWEQVKEDIMYDILKLKFDIPELRRKLLATGDRKLVEGNYWGDCYWGVCRGKGENRLGELLMKVRRECR